MDSNLANCDFLKQQFFDSASPLNIDSLLDAFNFLSTQTAKPKYRGQQRVEVFNNRYNLSLKNAVNLCLKIDDFVNLKAIGKGEFGEVRLVKFKQTGECFAMKILNKSTITRRMDEACFFEERDVMVQVKSPFIVNLNYAFQDELNLYIIMDFLPGGDLWQMLINTAEEWTEEWTRFYMAELLVALEDLHKTGYMHRDVKPENIMIDANGHFKLTDFGSSAKIPLKGFLDANTVAVGTPCYVAPEILKAEEYSESVDIFSFGCVLFETIMGSSPFESEENGSIFESNEKTKKIEYYFPPPDDELKYSPEFADLVKKLLVEKEKRLTIGQIKDHPFFSSIDWSKIRNMEITPPYKPTLKSNFDTTYFNDVDGEARAEGFTATPEFSVDHLPFVGFTYDKRHFTESKGKEKVRLAGNESEFVKTLQLELEEMKTKLTLADSAAKKEKQTLLEQIESLSSAEAELKSLECKYRAANRKLERLEQARKNSIQKQMEESKEVEKNYKRYETELRTTTSKLKQVTEELQQREASIKVLENQLLQQQTNRNVLNEKEMLELTSRLESLSLEKENIRAENHNLLKINTTLKEEMDAANEKMTSLTREIKKNKEVLDSIDQKYQTLQQDFHMLQAEKTKLLEDLCQRDEELKIKVKNLEDSRTFIDELNEMNSSLRQTLVQLTSELELSKTRLLNLSKSLNETKTDEAMRIQELEDELINIKTVKASSEVNLQQMNVKVEGLNQKVEFLEATSLKLSEELMAYKTKYAQALEEEKKNKAILVTNTSEVALLSRKLSHSSTELKAALSKLEQQNNTRKFLESSLSSLKSENETLNMKITELAAQLETFEIELAKQKEDNLSLATLRVEETAQLKKLEAQLEEANHDVSQLEFEKRELGRTLQLAEENCIDLKEEVEQLQEELRIEKEMIANSAVERKSLLREVDKLNVSLGEASLRLQTMEGEKEKLTRLLHITQAKLDQAVSKLEMVALPASRKKSNTSAVNKRAMKMLENQRHAEIAANKRLLEENQRLQSLIETTAFDNEKYEATLLELEDLKKKNEELQQLVNHLKASKGAQSGLQGYLQILKPPLKRGVWRTVYVIVSAEGKRMYLHHEQPRGSSDEPFETISIGHVFHARAVTPAELPMAKKEEIEAIFCIVYTKGSSNPARSDSRCHVLQDTGKSFENCSSCNERMLFSKVLKCRDCLLKCHANNPTCVATLKRKLCFNTMDAQCLNFKTKSVQEKHLWVETLKKIKTESSLSDSSLQKSNSTLSLGSMASFSSKKSMGE